MKLLVCLFCLCGGLSLPAQQKGIDVLQRINHSNYPRWDGFLKGVSFSAYPVALASPIGLSLHGHFSHQPPLLREGFRSAGTLAMAMGLTTALKFTVKRPRPVEAYPQRVTARTHASTYAFPSGHTTAAFASATSLSLAYRKWYVSVPAYCYAVFMGYTRMRLGVHYPGDVVAGALIGTGSAFVVRWLDQQLLKHRSPRSASENP